MKYVNALDTKYKKERVYMFWALVAGLVALFTFTVTKTAYISQHGIDKDHASEPVVLVFPCLACTCNLAEIVLTVLLPSHIREIAKEMVARSSAKIEINTSDSTPLLAPKSKRGDLMRLIVMAGPEK